VQEFALLLGLQTILGGHCNYLLSGLATIHLRESYAIPHRQT
jgi:hypothetical protein